MTRRNGAISLLVTLTLLAASLFVAPSVVDAQSNPYQRGPNPSAAALERGGPYSTATSSVRSSSVRGFGGGTIYYPTGTSDTFGGITISPGFTASSSSLSWYGRRLATHGFVAMVIDTNSRFDQPNSRASQLLAANDWLRSSSSPAAVRARLDGSRMAVSGHSMGGGGSLAASRSRQTLAASVPLTAWHSTKTFNTRVPQMIIGAQRDSTAPDRSHSVRFYNGLPNTTPKIYVQLQGAGHFAPNSTNATISRLSVAWLKRFVDNDTRYNTFLCGAERPTTSDRRISAQSNNCSVGWATPPTPTTTTPPTTQPPGDPGDPGDPTLPCVRSSNQTHVNRDRAVSIFGTAYARGSGDRLGSTSYFVFTSLQQTGATAWTQVSSCPS